MNIMETINTTDIPQTDAARQKYYDGTPSEWVHYKIAMMLEHELNDLWSRFDKQMEAEAEVERLRERLEKAEELIRGLHDGWKKARKAHLETCKNAQAEIDKLHTENICLQELIQEFYEWSRRDYPTEQEVREIMNRYHNLLNK